MNTKEMQDEIIRLKEELGVCILAHAYTSHNIWEIADYTGDSFGLSLQAAETDKNNILMCGVRFMAETVKILAPNKKVVLASPEAGCPMAEQVDAEWMRELKESNPGYTTVCYINTTAELKTECDICVTSSSAPEIIGKLDNDNILFVPDCNLGGWIQEQLPQKNIKMIQGGCPSHMRANKCDVQRMRKAHPDALLLVHPECLPEVTEMADYVGSTTGIMDFARRNDSMEYIIATENSIVEHLQFICPDKMFYPLSKQLICSNMKLTILADVYNSLLERAGEEIILPENIMAGARKCINEMIRLGS